MHATRRTVLGAAAAGLLMLPGIATAASAQSLDEVSLPELTFVPNAPDSNVAGATVTGTSGSASTLGGSAGGSIGFG